MFQKAIFTLLKTEKTLQLHDPRVLECFPDVLSCYIPLPGMAIYHPPTQTLAVRCAQDTVLLVEKVCRKL